MKKKKIFWRNPVEFAEIISDNYNKRSWVFLNSSNPKEEKNSTSYIALFPKKELKYSNLKELQDNKILSQDAWFGYISYESSHISCINKEKSFISLPKIYFISFSLIFIFHHERKMLEVIYDRKDLLEHVLNYKNIANNPLNCNKKIKNVASNFSEFSYLKNVKKIKKLIEEGVCYQVNLTRKFFGKFLRNIDKKDAFRMFLELNKSSLANYSSFINFSDNFILSSSPELFLKIENNNIISRPIKGTAPRSSNKKQDKINKENLTKSQKDKAENLMIVDLVRNDLARICRSGSVKVKNLFKISSYKNIHHMSSEIFGKLRKDISVIDCLLSCFPAGSMTGAPKIKSMEIIDEIEGIDRGVYSGAIGFLNLENKSVFSVVIRTLIISKDKFEFQSGGAITYDSNPKEELEELLVKSKTIFDILTAS